MAHETKVGLLLGLALILLVGLVLSDLFNPPAPDSADAAAPTGFGDSAQAGIYDPPPAPGSDLGGDRADAGYSDWAQPPQDYIPTRPAPVERAAPTKLDDPFTPPSPEPPTADLDTQQARDALARFDRTLEAMRLSAAPAPVENNPPAAGPTFFHDVEPGQTLTDIARQHYSRPDYAPALARANPQQVDNEGGVRPGTRLTVPPLGSAVFRSLFEPAATSHATRVRTDTAEPVPELPSRPADRREAEVQTVTVAPGDTLSELAAEHLGTATRWEDLLAANDDQLQRPEQLRAGMQLRLPGAAIAEAPPAPLPQVEAAEDPARTYTVAPGDSLARIARAELGDAGRWGELFELNAGLLDRPEHVRPGMVLRLP
ncbi:MAG: LysM peptidoglycan-binding domain-containing protein [Planctomycetota bacterium]